MKCQYCKDTKKIKKPLDQEKFDEYIDREMNKGYFVNAIIAEERAFKALGFQLVDCPYCTEKKDAQSE